MAVRYTKADLLAHITGMLTDSQKRVFQDFVKSGRTLEEWADTLGERKASVLKLFNEHGIVKAAYMAFNFNPSGVPEAVKEKEVPSLEWMLSELLDLYQAAKASEDEERQGKLLKQISDYQAKFGQMIDENALKFSSMRTEELVEAIKPIVQKISAFIQRKRWYDMEAVGHAGEDRGK